MIGLYPSTQNLYSGSERNVPFVSCARALSLPILTSLLLIRLFHIPADKIQAKKSQVYFFPYTATLFTISRDLYSDNT
jgi:hypothetical protein